MYQFSWNLNFPDGGNFSQYFVGTSFVDFAVHVFYKQLHFSVEVQVAQGLRQFQPERCLVLWCSLALLGQKYDITKEMIGFQAISAQAVAQQLLIFQRIFSFRAKQLNCLYKKRVGFVYLKFNDTKFSQISRLLMSHRYG